MKLELGLRKGAENVNFYTYKELRSATDKFNQYNKIGEGGFGSVYKVKFYYTNRKASMLRASKGYFNSCGFCEISFLNFSTSLLCIGIQA
ncbi:hypothetical protein RND81_09G012300 [Saponaria officinalis]|uniref:Protein kinase domain-containing protein n=1 Tax=Saponaria officinalis TaxID=3572 RepID=A0AAW1IFU4_SAPOF